MEKQPNMCLEHGDGSTFQSYPCQLGKHADCREENWKTSSGEDGHCAILCLLELQSLTKPRLFLCVLISIWTVETLNHYRPSSLVPTEGLELSLFCDSEISIPSPPPPTASAIPVKINKHWLKAGCSCLGTGSELQLRGSPFMSFTAMVFNNFN